MNMMIVMNLMMRISIPDNTNRIILNVCFSFAGSACSSNGCDLSFFWTSGFTYDLSCLTAKLLWLSSGIDHM